MRNKRKGAARTGVKRGYRDLGYSSPGEMFRAWIEDAAQRVNFMDADGEESSPEKFERIGDIHDFDGDSKWPEPETPIDRTRRTKRTGLKTGKKSTQEKCLRKTRRKI